MRCGGNDHLGYRRRELIQQRADARDLPGRVFGQQISRYHRGPDLVTRFLAAAEPGHVSLRVVPAWERRGAQREFPRREQARCLPLIIATGGVNRHNQVNEAREFHRVLNQGGVPDSAIRIEDRSANTWQNVEFSLQFLREALDSGLAITAIAKWYHRRTVHMLKYQLPEIGRFHVITWEPAYNGQLVTRAAWPGIPGGSRRVIREWEEVTRRVADGSLAAAGITGGAWS